MSGRRYDVEEVRGALTADDVIAHYGWSAARSGQWFRLRECPRCGAGSSPAFAVGERGFRCHRCGVHGDLIGLVALVEGLDVRQDFERALEVAAAIAEVSPRGGELTAEERARRRWWIERRRREVARRCEREERARWERAAAVAGARWDRLRAGSWAGEDYLRERGLEELEGRSDLVRFDGRGNVCVPGYDTTGRIVNVVTRRRPPLGSGPKVRGMKGCPARCVLGNPGELARTEGRILVTEGVVDYLSALVIWPGRAVFGAHGASNLPSIAEMVARAIADTERELCFVPHHDPAGLSAGAKAVAAAISAGVPRHRVYSYDTSRAGDLNDWLRASAVKDGRSPL